MSRVTAANDVTIKDVDPSTGLATLTCTPVHGRNAWSSQINLINGQLSVLKPKPRTGDEATESQLSSPDRKFALCYTGPTSAQVILFTRSGKTLAEIDAPDPYLLRDAGWSPRSTACYVVDLGAPARFLVFRVGDRDFTTVVAGQVDEVQWSADGRYLACIACRTPASLPSYVAMGVGVVRVYDASSLKQVLSTARLASGAKLSPDGNRIAFVEIVRDEYGDYAKYDLRVADIRSGRVISIATNRREPKYAWAGNDRVSVVTYDRYAVPTLSMVDVATRKTTTLATSREFARFEPVAYIASKQLVAYKASTGIEGEKPEELWAARPGGAPVPLFPKVRGASHGR
jgi:hypothetical protein